MYAYQIYIIFFYNYDRNRFPKKYHNICYDNKKRTLEKNSVQKK